MKQGRLWNALGVALALTAVPLAAHAAKQAKPADDTQAAAPAAKPRVTVRQFTGTITSLDRTSLTVEKRGKNPRSMVFRRDAALTLGEGVGKDARVTVYYRDEDGHAVAQRVVAKAPASRASKSPPSEGSAGGGR